MAEETKKPASKKIRLLTDVLDTPGLTVILKIEFLIFIGNFHGDFLSLFFLIYPYNFLSLSFQTPIHLALDCILNFTRKISPSLPV